MNRLIKTSVCSLILFSSSATHATTVIGGSEIFANNNYAHTLEAYLNGYSQALTLTNIFTKNNASTIAEFHTAADGMGATFSVMEVGVPIFNEQTNEYEVVTKVIGGYNPKSWSNAGFNYIENDLSKRTAFLFNLTENLVFRENLGCTTFCNSEYQTTNSADVGPAFGIGQDLAVFGPADGESQLLARVFSALYVYTSDDSLYEGSGGSYGVGGPGNNYTLNKMEVFTLAPEISAVPLPASYSLLITGLALLGGIARGRKNNK